MNTPEEVLQAIDECYGPCTKICISCPAGEFLREIRDVIIKLMEEKQGKNADKDTDF